MAVSGGSGAVMAVEEIGDCVIEKAKVVAGWVATAGKFATNFISWWKDMRICLKIYYQLEV